MRAEVERFESAAFPVCVRRETFRPRDDIFMLYVAINGGRAEIEVAWLVSSAVLAAEAIVVNKQR